VGKKRTVGGSQHALAEAPAVKILLGGEREEGAPLPGAPVEGRRGMPMTREESIAVAREVCTIGHGGRNRGGAAGVEKIDAAEGESLKEEGHGEGGCRAKESPMITCKGTQRAGVVPADQTYVGAWKKGICQ
jgi:hypothetical protein